MLQHKGGHHEGKLGGEFGLAATQLARTSAIGPEGSIEGGNQPIGIGPAGTTLFWRVVGDFPSVAFGTDIPITPKVSGKLAITGSVGFVNTDTAATHTVIVHIEDSITGLLFSTVAVTIPAATGTTPGAVQVPIDFTIGGAGNPPVPSGSSDTIKIVAIADVAGFVSATFNNGFVDVQEVLA
jgi:hypothetical protein